MQLEKAACSSAGGRKCVLKVYARLCTKDAGININQGVNRRGSKNMLIRACAQGGRYLLVLRLT